MAVAAVAAQATRTARAAEVALADQQEGKEGQEACSAAPAAAAPAAVLIFFNLNLLVNVIQKKLVVPSPSSQWGPRNAASSLPLSRPSAKCVKFLLRYWTPLPCKMIFI
jgi:hypothetical protein